MRSGQRILGFPQAWREHTGRLLGPVAFEVAGYRSTFNLTMDHLEHVCLPILARLEERVQSGRVLAALAGIPGSGKSTLGCALQYVADRVLGPGRFALVGCDGWHYPNAVLDHRMTVDETGRPVPLRERKGGPESYDVAAMAVAMAALRTGDRSVRLPVYDRRRHDPVADVQEVRAETRIVLAEGNFLLSDTQPWNAVSSLLELKLFVTCEATVARDRVIARHIRGGCTAEQAARKYAVNDQLNTQIVLATACQADWTIQYEPELAVWEWV